jgi:DNA primase
LKFLFLPEGEDPDTYVRKQGREAFEKALGGAVPLSRFLLDEVSARVDLATAEGRAKCLHEAKPLLKQIPAGGLRLQLVRELAERCRVSPEEVSQLFELGAAPARSRPPEAQVPRKPVTPLAEQLLRVLVSNPGCAGKVTTEQRALLDGPEFGPVAELVDVLKGRGVVTSAMLVEATRDSRYADLYQSVAGQTLTVTGDDETARADLEGVFNKLEHDQVKIEFEKLNASGVRNERFQELSRRLAELKGASGGEARTRA